MDLTIHPELQVPLADYTWLPQEYHATFQAVLEKADGVAPIHFIAEVERCIVTGSDTTAGVVHGPQNGPNSSTRIGANGSSRGNETHDMSATQCYTES